MSIVVNGTTIPTTGDYIIVNGTKVDTVNVVQNGISTTVWTKNKAVPYVFFENGIRTSAWTSTSSNTVFALTHGEAGWGGFDQGGARIAIWLEPKNTTQISNAYLILKGIPRNYCTGIKITFSIFGAAGWKTFNIGGSSYEASEAQTVTITSGARVFIGTTATTFDLRLDVSSYSYAYQSGIYITKIELVA